MEAIQRIKEAAVREFAQHGYDGARLERIARAAGVHTAQIHYYFRNKRGLYEAIQNELVPPSLEKVTEPLREASKPLPERVQVFYQRFYEAAHSLSLPRVGQAPHLLPPLLLSPNPLQLPEWIEALQSAQAFGLIKPLRIEFILTQQWGLALIPLWFSFPPAEWEKYYCQEAPRLFWEAVKGV
ncbi:MAG: TetR/AcrR family transcriptional regulator [Bacteroidia bacterium]|nr:TetR/AcrR family transcriptional regulator [Bacteroidia bacterium]MDW8015901.1 TetR/AcrR family transcriptional regulator [Bacteroidia bacterium]